jgi:transposase
VEDIREMHQQGLSITGIAELTGVDRKTVRKWLTEPGPPRYGPRPSRPSKLDPFQSYIAQRLTAGVWNATILLRELREQGYTGGYTILKAFLHPKRQAAREVAVRRFETPPGQQAQVDWGHLGEEVRDGHARKVWGFVLTLGHSRAFYADVATDQQLETLLRLHETAFHALGGVPEEILYDRIKTVVLGTDERGEVRWHPGFWDFAQYWGFRPRLCRAYRAQTKGKVESGIRYLRSGFMPGRHATSVEDLRTQLHAWVAGIANRRVHGTTHQVVLDAWQAEQPHLQSLAGRPAYPYVPMALRRVARDAFVTYSTNRYSVPWLFAGRDVWIREAGETVEVHYAADRIAVHARCPRSHQVVTQAAHHQGIPFHPVHQPPRGKIIVQGASPDVEVRPLIAYELVGGGGGEA